MQKWVIVLGSVAALGGCGQSAPDGRATTSNSSAAKAAASSDAPRQVYCFFQDSETKDWKAKVDKSGNVVVTGKAYREDPRYKALLAPAQIKGTTAELTPTIAQNDTGFAAPGNWWALSETIPQSQSITTVMVKCNDQPLASLAVPRAK
jgi:hypothetical protein